MTRPAQHAADVGLAREDALAADGVAQDVLVPEAVLQRQHDGIGPDQRQGAADRRVSVERLDQHHDHVGRADFGRLCRRVHAYLPGAAGVVDPQAVATHRIDVCGRAVDQPGLVTAFGEGGADRTTQCAGS